MQAKNHKIVICGGMRTPIGHISRSLSEIQAPELMCEAVAKTLEASGTPKSKVDGLIVGWVGQDFTAPNIARVSLLKSGACRKSGGSAFSAVLSPQPAACRRLTDWRWSVSRM